MVNVCVARLVTAIHSLRDGLFQSDLILALYRAGSSGQPTLLHHNSHPLLSLLAHCSTCPRRNSEARRATALTHKVGSGPVLWSLISWESTVDHVPTDSEDQSSRDFHDLYRDSTLGGLGGAGSPGPLHGAFDPSRFTIDWSLETDMSSLPAYQLPESLDFGPTSSMNQHLDPMMPQTATPQHQWNPGSQVPAPLNNFRVPLFNPNSARVAGAMQQGQFSSAAGNNQSTVPSFVTQGVGAR